jgi:excisionase family DNA binding protein
MTFIASQTCPFLNCGAPPQPAASVDEWWGVEKAAQYLGLKPKTVRENAADGILPGRKFPPNSTRGKWRFKKEALDRFLNRGQNPPRKQANEPSIWE